MMQSTTKLVFFITFYLFYYVYLVPNDNIGCSLTPWTANLGRRRFKNVRWSYRRCWWRRPTSKQTHSREYFQHCANFQASKIAFTTGKHLLRMGKELIFVWSNHIDMHCPCRNSSRFRRYWHQQSFRYSIRHLKASGAEWTNLGPPCFGD